MIHCVAITGGKGCLHMVITCAHTICEASLLNTVCVVFRGRGDHRGRAGSRWAGVGSPVQSLGRQPPLAALRTQTRTLWPLPWAAGLGCAPLQANIKTPSLHTHHSYTVHRINISSAKYTDDERVADEDILGSTVFGRWHGVVTVLKAVWSSYFPMRYRRLPRALFIPDAFKVAKFAFMCSIGTLMGGSSRWHSGLVDGL